MPFHYYNIFYPLVVGRHQINARDDYVVEKKSGEKLFKLFSSAIGEERSVLRTIEGGHLSSFMASQYFFVPAILKSFELLEEN